MSTSTSIWKSWPRRVLAVIVCSLSLVASLGLAAVPVVAAPKEGKGQGGDGGGGADRGGRPGRLEAVSALSRHRLLATYDKAPGSDAMQPASYAFISASGASLPILAVSPGVENQVLISTGPQEAVTYQVEKPKAGRMSFTGSVAGEPTLQGATAVSSTQVLLSFSEPMGVGADQASSYQVTVQGTTSGLAVLAAVPRGVDQVMLTTAVQQPTTYGVTVGDVKGQGGTYLDPTADTAAFAGSTVAAGPMLLSATPRGDTQLVLTFDSTLSAAAADPARYTATPGLVVNTAALLTEKQVLLGTGPQYQLEYTVVADVVGADGNAVNPGFNSATFTGTRPPDTDGPRVVSAGSTNNTTVVVQFSEAMADDAVDKSHYVIVQENVNPEVGTVGIVSAAFVDANRLSVQLTTQSQAEVTYRVIASNVTDLFGNPLADKVTTNGVLVDPTSFVFPGTPPTGAERVDTDKDGIFDHEETAGYTVVIRLANGGTNVRQVTSSIAAEDTDDDGLTDAEEKSLIIDPRDNDTDDDGLLDYVEFNEIFSDPVAQDSDDDDLFDGLEVATFSTSPLLDDTDGDQLLDGYEINVNRNPKVADLPQPVLEVGEMTMGLDVRFTESNGNTTRELDAETVEATLVQSESQEFSKSESATHAVSAMVSQTTGLELGVAGGVLSGWDYHATLSFENTTEVTDSNSWTSEFTDTSSRATEEAHTDSMTTEVEVAADSNVTRTVEGARMQLGVFLASKGNVAFTVNNLQVAALIQDPQDPTRLTPIATLLPVEPSAGINLGPLVPPKGPIIFTSSDIYPHLVDELMRNPRGLVFRFANYDIVDESGRNFAFTSQEVNDRTARVAIDFGGFDEDGDGQGDDTEIIRVATGVIGRRVVDTNDDGVIDDLDRKVVFDGDGKQVGITLRDALGAAGLVHYDETTQPSNSLSPADKERSYSTVKSADGTGEFLFRVRGRQMQLGTPTSWEILTPTGIDRSLDLDEHLLYPGTSLTLAFLQDLDDDRLPALTETMNGCAESAQKDAAGKYPSRDSDSDGLDDRFEVLVGWDVNTQRGIREVRSRCWKSDSDDDGLSDRQEAPGIVNYDDAGLVLFDLGAAPYVQDNAPRRDTSTPADPSLGWALSDPVTDPNSKDTDVDGLEDNFELTPYRNELRPPNPPGTFTPERVTSPERFDSDGDSASDGVERKLGGDPRVADLANIGDSDGDGLVDALELSDYEVKVRTIRPRTAFILDVCRNGACAPQASETRLVHSDPATQDTDADGLTDSEERDLVLDPTSDDTDGDGLTDFEEVRGLQLRDLGLVETDPANADTDNDKRSDGEEADRGDMMIVRIPGKAPYQAFSHPLRPDGDLDMLVDGDEQAFGVDPAVYNTDEDNQTDYSEVVAGRRPLVPDFIVSVGFGTLVVTKAGDDSGGRGPDGELNWNVGIARQSVPDLATFIEGTASRSAGEAIALSDRLSLIGPISTTDAMYEEFSVLGTIDELDEDATDCSVRFPGNALPEGDLPGTMAGSTLKPGLQTWSLHRKVTCLSGDDFDVTLYLAVRAS